MFSLLTCIYDTPSNSIFYSFDIDKLRVSLLNLTHLDIQLDDSRYDEGQTSQDSTRGHLSQRRVEEQEFLDDGINRPLEDRDEDDDEQRIDHLELVGLDEVAEHLAVHSRRLEGPSRALLIEQGPEEGQRNEEHEDL